MNNGFTRITLYMLVLVVLSGMANSKSIEKSAVIAAPIDSVWAAWTTPEGVKSFFAPDCKIELKPGGAYEMYFDSEAPAGQRGSEGCVVKYLNPETELHFTWNAPPHLPDVRKERTLVKLYLTALSDSETQVKLVHEGWGEGKEWNKAFEYFDAVWGQVVLARLQYRFVNGPIDWNNPPPM